MYGYWGKAKPADAVGRPYHLLVYHSLDVAAVGELLLARHPTLLARLAEALAMDAARVRPLLVFLLAIHDLGKFAETFQGLQPELLAQLQGRRLNRFESMRHDTLGYLLWREALWPRLEADGWLGVGTDRAERRHWRQALEVCLQAVTGHHGQPPKSAGRTGELLLSNFFAANDIHAAEAYARAAADLLLRPVRAAALAPDPKALTSRLKVWSWWLAGFGVLCDWIGSNQDHFRYHIEQMPLADYWRDFALPRAAAALDEAAVLPAPAADLKSLQDLFPAVHQPTPLQRQVEVLPLGDGPQLYILEDVTGAGKTEAAMMLVHRLMSAGQAEGAYVALPTMATANAMYQRMADCYQRLFANGSRPSLVLAHGARELVDRFRESIVPAGAADAAYGPAEPDSATVQCAAWLADQRKKALLANLGVGTIDQALLAVLYSRHQSLRLFGLLGKVLVVDEVHACDAYVNRLLRTLLTFHAAAGGSAVLLSATLPRETRLGLVKAFCAGGGAEPPALTRDDYPLLTQVSGEVATECPLATRPEVQRRVEVVWLDGLDDVRRLILEAAAAGRCVCWVRNSVADALEAHHALAESLPDGALHLFHARYAMGDRLAIEDRVLRRFGKDSGPAERVGQVLIATQVVEQSLDLDFDLMISDLAPVDLLIQRAGRLHRHRRREDGTASLDGKDRRGPPRLAVYGPRPEHDAGEDWLTALLPKAARVYPNHARLWLTARLLTESGGFRMPEDARRLIEGVYGEDADATVPMPLQASALAAEGDASSARSLARQNSLDLTEGYATPALDWWDDAVTPTRLGDPMVTLRLARWEQGHVRPWIAGRHGWALSEVSVRQALVAAEAEPADPVRRQAVEAAKLLMPDGGKWSVLVVLEERDGWRGQVLDRRRRVVTVRYSSVTGLVVGASDGSSSSAATAALDEVPRKAGNIAATASLAADKDGSSQAHGNV